MSGEIDRITAPMLARALAVMQRKPLERLDDYGLLTLTLAMLEAALDLPLTVEDRDALLRAGLAEMAK